MKAGSKKVADTDWSQVQRTKLKARARKATGRRRMDTVWYLLGSCLRSGRSACWFASETHREVEEEEEEKKK